MKTHHTDTDSLAATLRHFGGTLYLVRPLHSGDESRLLSFFQSHTAETIYGRYGYSVVPMSDERAADLVNVDQTKDRALGIFDADPGCEVLFAVGRYCLDPDGQGAEVAFVVHESTRNHGMATFLLRELIGTARQRGLRRLWAQVSIDNSSMIHLLERNRFAFKAEDFSGALKATLELLPPAEKSREC